VLRPAILAFQQSLRRARMAKADLPGTGVVLPYKAPVKPAKVAARKRPVVAREAVAAAR
jgi:hypothetical protein